ncbi:HNRPM protein, partial [Atractosteus spatula]|nr:HNRPM protein [Atractosteus spatula]
MFNSVVEFRTEELMKKAVEKVNKHVLNGRPLKVKEDVDGEFARRAAQRAGGGPPPGGMGMGMGPGPGGPSMVNIPPSLMNNPNIPSEIIHGLQAGKIGSTVFVANLDYKVGWKKLKEVFGMAGNVIRADILEDKDGKSRGMGTISFELPIEAVQAVSMFNGQLLFNRVMHVKLDEKSLPKGDFPPPERPPQLPRGLSGIGLGLGPGGQPIDANQLNRGGGGGMGNMGPGGMDGMGYGNVGRMGGMDNFGGGMSSMDRYGPSGMGRMSAMFNGQLLFNRVMHVKLDEKSLPKGDFPPPERPPQLPRGLSGIGLGLGPGGQPIDANQLNRGGGGGMGNMGPGGVFLSFFTGMDGMGYGNVGRMGGMDNFGGGMSSMDRYGPSGMGRMSVDSLFNSCMIFTEMERGLGGGYDREFGRSEMGMSRSGFGDSFERGMGNSMGMDRMSSNLDRMGSGMDRMPGMDRVGMGMDRMDRVSDMDRLGSGYDRMGSGLDRLGPSMDRSGLDRMGSSLDRMGSGGVGAQFDRPADLERGGFGAPFGGAGGGGPGSGMNARKGCQIFVRNLPFDFTWKMLKDTFNSCGHVQYADIKMENGKSKGCGVVRFENPETAERACRTMNGYRLNGREIDVRIDRNA